MYLWVHLIWDRVLTTFENYGFDGIAVALTGACNAIGIVLSGLLFGLLKVIQPMLQINGVPKEIGEIISSCYCIVCCNAVWYKNVHRLDSKKES